MIAAIVFFTVSFLLLAGAFLTGFREGQKAERARLMEWVEKRDEKIFSYMDSNE